MESDEIQFVSTQRKQQKLVYRGRCYTLKRTNRNDKCWTCATRGCPGILWTNVETTRVIRISEHAESCRVDAHAFNKHHQLDELKRLAAEDPRPVTQIYHELASSASAGNFPTWNQARHIMYYSRARRFPRLPETRQEPHPTAEQRAANSGEQAGMGLLAQSNWWCGDEILKILPSWYQQLFTLHVFMRDKLLPVFHSKAEELGVPLNLVTFVCDFETALISAIQGNFLNIRIQGCFFHFFQAVLRQVGRLGLKTDYINNQEIRKKVKMLMALAFLPVNLVPAGFEILNVGTSGQVEALFQYFQREWLPATKIPL
ncbi:hypothetical protein T11_3383 [Trichinella zimbabwensis]|uniref:FLYWCH-type domain-containing protein n=1 Tax=Trichinella zimbabwensis TaxID=268475 RepID=A0A0V1HL14_9BILA|nr:hypothetical protein T11_3383 [Trichinella zimbabwensis]